MKIIKQFIVCFLAYTLVAQGQGNVFNKIRYNGGSVDSKVDPKDWNNRLTVTPDTITLALKDGKKVDIPARSVTSLSYGQEAHRRVGTMIALSILVAPVALFGLFHKTRLHYIGIQYAVPDNKTAGILLQGDKDNYRAVLVALQGVTGVPVSVGEKDREFVPVGVKTDVTKGQTDENAPGKNQTVTSEAAKGTVNVASVPPGADLLVDGEFIGNCPAVLKLAPGKHTITAKLSGYKDWTRQITVQTGSEVQLTANLEKQN
ncbi:MAG: PEGA domain-containing protein [Acidobacteriia bacterium]|nr:PEGA domain-containing protein [Terriglobia bacterium]